MRALIVVPTYNEIENLKALLDAVFAVIPSEVEVLVVDDGSPDGTGELADSLAAQNPRLHVLHRAAKQGLGTAYVAGFKWGMAKYSDQKDKAFEAFIEMDADFSHNPKYLPVMLEHLKSYDFVIGSRYVEGGGTLNWGMGRKILSRGGSIYSSCILGVGIRDFTGGFNGWKRRVVAASDLDTLRSDGYSFQIELKHRAALNGFKHFEFPIIFEDRKVGKSKMSKKIVFEALRRVWSFRMNAARSGRRADLR